MKLDFLQFLGIAYAGVLTVSGTAQIVDYTLRGLIRDTKGLSVHWFNGLLSYFVATYILWVVFT